MSTSCAYANPPGKMKHTSGWFAAIPFLRVPLDRIELSSSVPQTDALSVELQGLLLAILTSDCQIWLKIEEFIWTNYPKTCVRLYPKPFPAKFWVASLREGIYQAPALSFQHLGRVQQVRAFLEKKLGQNSESALPFAR